MQQASARIDDTWPKLHSKKAAINSSLIVASLNSDASQKYKSGYLGWAAGQMCSMSMCPGTGASKAQTPASKARLNTRNWSGQMCSMSMCPSTGASKAQTPAIKAGMNTNWPGKMCSMSKCPDTGALKAQTPASKAKLDTKNWRVKGINTCKQSQGITTQGKSAACQIKEDKEIGKSGHKEHKEDKGCKEVCSMPDKKQGTQGQKEHKEVCSMPDQ
eukprot:45563-Pelagomonas_calceolata.AAC.2